jgi:hypothetical protein
MMLKSRPVMPALGAMSALAAVVMLGAAPALAQSDSNGAYAYRDGVQLGRTLRDARQCTGSGDFYGGCVDGVQESQFDREADQALDSATSDARPADHAPALSPPPDLFQQPFSKPDDGQPPNN